MQRNLTLLFLVMLLAVFAARQAFSEPPPNETFERLSLELTRYSGDPVGSAPLRHHTSHAPTGAAAGWVPDWTAYTFQGGQTNWEVMVHDRLTASDINLTNHPAEDIHPRFNTGATEIVFASNRTGSYELYRINPNGTGLTRLTHTGHDNVYPVWTPDGQQIVFQSYRDGQPEIYRMNRDGSGQTRLTFDPDYDGMPAVSPDGSKIAFVSRRTGGYRIYTMNQDGTGVRQLNNEALSGWPVWSADGARIAYTADINQDTWLDALLMNQDGSNVQVLLSEATRDFFTHSWRRIISDTLPELPPAPFDYVGFSMFQYVFFRDRWWLYDNGMGMILGTNSVSWLNSRYPNVVGGLDLQATDTLPPVTTVTPLPEFSRHDRVQLFWQRRDLGQAEVSGVGARNVQYRIGESGTWTPLPYSPGTWAPDGASGSILPYVGSPGEQVWFRVRSIDNARNIEPWEQAPVAGTTLFRNRLTGNTLDARGYPVPGATFTAAPELLRPSADFSGWQGAYTLYTATSADYLVGAARPPYGAFEPVGMPLSADRTHTFILPPAQNLLANPGFEQQSGWLLTGDPQITGNGIGTHHSGQQALRFGASFHSTATLYTTPEPDDIYVTTPAFYVEPSGALHQARAISANATTVHLEYGMRPPGDFAPVTPGVIASWPFDETIGNYYSLKIIPDERGGLHFLVQLNSVGNYNIHHLYCHKPAGSTTCASPQSFVTTRYDLPSVFAFVEPVSGTLYHLLFSPDARPVVLSRTWQGAWQTQELPFLPASRLPVMLLKDSQGQFLLPSRGTDGLYLYTLRSNGGWNSRMMFPLPAETFFPEIIPYVAGSQAHLLIKTRGQFTEWGPGRPSTETERLYHLWQPDSTTPWETVMLAERLVPLAGGDPKRTGIVSSGLSVDAEGNVRLGYLDIEPAFLPAQPELRYIFAAKAAGAPWQPLREIAIPAIPSYRVLSIQPVMLENGGLALLEAHDLDTGSYGPIRVLREYPPSEEGRVQSASQVVTVPAEGHRPTFSAIARQETILAGDHRLELIVDDGAQRTPVATRTTFAEDDWNIVWGDLTPWQGQTVTVTLAYEQPATTLPSYLYVDGVSLGDWRTPVITAVSPAKVPMGSPITLTGLNFMPGATVRVGTVAWVVTSAETTTLTAAMPATISPGLYPVFVRNPGSEEAVWSWLQVGERLLLPIIAR